MVVLVVLAEALEPLVILEKIQFLEQRLHWAAVQVEVNTLTLQEMVSMVVLEEVGVDTQDLVVQQILGFSHLLKQAV
jgi:hypothetical protein